MCLYLYICYVAEFGTLANGSHTHKRLKERFLIRRNRTTRANFEVVLFFKLRTMQQKTVKPTYLCPLGARKLAEGKGHETA